MPFGRAKNMWPYPGNKKIETLIVQHLVTITCNFHFP